MLLQLTSQFTEQKVQDIPGMYIGIQSRLTRYQMLLQSMLWFIFFNWVEIFDLLPASEEKTNCESKIILWALTKFLDALKNIKSILKSSEEEVTKLVSFRSRGGIFIRTAYTYIHSVFFSLFM